MHANGTFEVQLTPQPVAPWGGQSWPQPPFRRLLGAWFAVTEAG